MRSAYRHPLRTATRLASFLAVIGTSILHHRWYLRRTGKEGDPTACSRWMVTWGRNTLKSVGVRYGHCGPVPNHGLVVCNHLSYLDIAVLAAAGPMIFVSKADVQSWPLLGTLARCGGSLFIRRESRFHVAEIAAAFRPIVEGGTVITMFPEGTSSGGADILPFRSSLLEPAATCDWPVTPACIQYEIADGTVSEDVAYWRDMVFAPHFLNLLSKRRIKGHVSFGTPLRGIRDRKELARRLHHEVCQLKERTSLNLTNL